MLELNILAATLTERDEKALQTEEKELHTLQLGQRQLVVDHILGFGPVKLMDSGIITTERSNILEIFCTSIIESYKFICP